MKKSILGIMGRRRAVVVEAQAQQYQPRNLRATVVDETGLDISWDHPAGTRAEVAPVGWTGIAIQPVSSAMIIASWEKTGR